MNFNLNVKADIMIHSNEHQSVMEALAGLKQLIQSTGEKTLMAVSDAEKALVKAFDDETNRIAEAIAALDKDDPEFNALLQAQIDKLKGVGKGGSVPQA